MSRKLKPLNILPDQRELLVTRDHLTQLLLESHKKAANSAEEIMAIREMGKLHKLYEQTPMVQINNLSIEKNQKKIEVLSDEELLQMAGNHPHLFKKPDEVKRVGKDKKEEIIDADFKEVK